EGGPITKELDVVARVALDLDRPCDEECQIAADRPCAAEPCPPGKRVARIAWTIETLTGDPLEGFLIPEDGSGQGQGSVWFSVLPVAGLAHDSDLENDGVILFDGQQGIRTNVWTNRIDLSIPP